MTLLTIAQGVARNASLELPDTVQSADDPDAVKIVGFINETGQELARRFDWSVLRKTHLIEGTGFDVKFPLPADYSRMTQGMAVAYGVNAVRGGVSDDEWFSLEPAEGAPRYFKLFGASIGFYPYPPEGQPVRLSYISKHWTADGDTFLESDSDIPLIDETLLERGAIWRMRRHIGQDYQDYLAEFEAILADMARADRAERLP